MTDGTQVLEAFAGETTPPLRVLLVQDNPADGQLITDMLREAAPDRVSLTHAGGLEHARGQLVEVEFDAILFDLSLPQGEGLATFAAAQAMAHDAPIVVLAGTWDAELAASAVRSGAQDYLVKGQTDGRLRSHSCQRTWRGEYARSWTKIRRRASGRFACFLHTSGQVECL